MADKEKRSNTLIIQGPTTLFIQNDKPRLASRGAAIEFNTMADLLEFAGELSIIMVGLAQELAQVEQDRLSGITESES